MRQSGRTIALETASTLLSLAGVVLVLAVGVRGVLALEANTLGALSALDGVVLVAGVGLVAAARRLDPGVERRLTLDPHTRVGRHQPEPSELEALGYRVPRDPPGDSERTTAYEDGTLYRLCPACEERNETDFDYCRHCSAELEP
jgi:hypothetical protein